MRALVIALPLLLASCLHEVAHQEDEPFDDRSNEAMQGLFDCSIRTDTGYRDGDPFPIDVITVDDRPVERKVGNAYLAMQAAAADDGVRVRIVSGFRTMAQQQYLHQCFVDCDCNNCNLAAVPGTSNHQSGHALDLNTSDPGVYAWLDRNAARFGFRRTVPSEAWHWEHWGAAPNEPCGPNGLVDDDGLSERARDALGAIHLHDPAASSDVDGDGVPDLCARTASGFACFVGDGAGGFGARRDGPELSDDDGWTAARLRSLRTADFDGDADVCARARAGWRCWRSRGASAGGPRDVAPFGGGTTHPILADADGFDDPSRVVFVADVDGDGAADVCARGRLRFHCWTDGFTKRVEGPEWSDDRGWDRPERFGTIRMGDVDGDGRDDVCGRGADGVRCFVADRDGAPLARAVAGPSWGDDAWRAAERWSTIRLADVDGDGRADLCARGPDGWACRRSRIVAGRALLGDAFGPALRGPSLLDGEGWGRRAQLGTLQLADVDADGDLDLCGRHADGARCWLFDGDGFAGGFTTTRMSDGAGWDEPSGWRTVRVVDVDADGRADLCGRGADGWRCFHGTGDGFGARRDGPTWIDDGPFARVEHHGTIRLR